MHPMMIVILLVFCFYAISSAVLILKDLSEVGDEKEVLRKTSFRSLSLSKLKALDERASKKKNDLCR